MPSRIRAVIVTLALALGIVWTASATQAQTLQWTYPELSQAQIDGFRIERAPASPGTTQGTVTCGAFIQVQELGAAVRTWKDTILPGASYCYRLRAYNALLSSDSSNVASFGAPLPAPTLVISKAGDGTGKITSTPPGIACGGLCSATFQHGQIVTLAQRATGGSTWDGWGGACFGSGACQVAMVAGETTYVTAAFGKR